MMYKNKTYNKTIEDLVRGLSQLYEKKDEIYKKIDEKDIFGIIGDIYLSTDANEKTIEENDLRSIAKKYFRNKRSGAEDVDEWITKTEAVIKKDEIEDKLIDNIPENPEGGETGEEPGTKEELPKAGNYEAIISEIEKNKKLSFLEKEVLRRSYDKAYYSSALANFTSPGKSRILTEAYDKLVEKKESNNHG